MKKTCSTGIARWLVCGILILVPLVAQSAQKGVLIKGMVSDGSRQPVANATVYLVPADDVAKLAKAPSIDIKKNVPNDEPLEDNVAANRDKYLKGITNTLGSFSIKNVPNGKFFIYTEPSDKTHLPGGNIANKAMTTAEIAKQPLKISLSGRIPDDASFVGSTQCLSCHGGYSAMTKTLHKLGISAIGKQSKLQDFSRFPDYNDGLKRLMAGVKLYVYGYDKKRGFDKYVISEKMPSDPASVSFTATFFKDSEGKLRFRTENSRNPADPPKTYTVEMVYGGGLYKQRYLYRVGDSLYPFLQYNPTGKEEYDDRIRKTWRDYHADWLYNEDTNKLVDPPKKKSFENECASCHYNGYTLTPTVSGSFVAGAVNDPNGEADIDGDGIPNELNIGCESCHGPGSAHVKAGKNMRAATIVNPGKLASERVTVICIQCHSRPQGNLKNDQPVNKENRMLIPGISRNEYLINHTTREDAAQADFWNDGIHSKTHHQQGTDFIRSKKYINATQLLNCASCHDPHGKSGIKRQLRMEVRDDKNSLCVSCHKNITMLKHTEKTVGMAHNMKISCIDCHMPKTMITGGGLGKGITGKDGKNYWMNDITAHVFAVPRKYNKGVKGVEPGKAMPIPYTNACGTCHDAGNL